MADAAVIEACWEEGRLESLTADALNRYLRDERVSKKDALVLGVGTHLSRKRKRDEDDKVCQGGGGGPES
jgi:hypothetical protein